jgi:hypothetical protein
VPKLAEFERELQLATADLAPEQIAGALAAFAKQSLREVLAEQGGRSDLAPHYDVAVNGRLGAAEESVIPPGPIVYTFDYATEIAGFALEFLRARGPKKSGHWQRSFFILVGGQEVRSPEEIPPGAAFLVVNDVPYARKIAIGAMKLSVPNGIYEAARQAVRSLYGKLVKVEVRFIDLAGAYRLKRNHGRRGRRRGDAITYPALAITPIE